MTGYFWQTRDVNAFGAYTPSLGTGLYHIADEDVAGGIKLWSYGVGADSAWSTLSTAAGTWLAGTGAAELSKKILSTCRLGVAKALLARLYRLTDDHDRALQAIQSIEEPWIQLHPQIVVERDKLLRGAGMETIPLREKWLSSVNALSDEWVIERRVQLLIDQGEIKRAKALLLSTPFQKVHQTYSRTHLWKQICGKLGEPCVPIPVSLGEDKLATFGAYREFE